jgi:hypothetical protein
METSEDMTQSRTTNFWPRSERKLQKKLRNTGQEYVSRSGKIIPAKKQPGERNSYLSEIVIFTEVLIMTQNAYTASSSILVNILYTTVPVIKVFLNSLWHIYGHFRESNAKSLIITSQNRLQQRV